MGGQGFTPLIWKLNHFESKDIHSLILEGFRHWMIRFSYSPWTSFAEKNGKENTLVLIGGIICDFKKPGELLVLMVTDADGSLSALGFPARRWGEPKRPVSQRPAARHHLTPGKRRNTVSQRERKQPCALSFYCLFFFGSSHRGVQGLWWIHWWSKSEKNSCPDRSDTEDHTSTAWLSWLRHVSRRCLGLRQIMAWATD